MRKLDIFNHVYPVPFFDVFMKVAPTYKDIGKRMRNIPMLADLDVRFRVMDQFDDYHQILSLPTPPIEAFAGREHALDLAKAANDGMAELVQRYPDRFPGFVASLPLEHRRQADLGAGVPAAVRVDGRVRPADLDAPVPRRRHAGLQDRRTIGVRDLVDVRLAVRYQRGDGAAGLRRLLRSVSAAEDHHAPYGRHDSVLRRPNRPRLGSARCAHLGPGLFDRPEVAGKASVRLFQDVLRRHGAVWRLRRDGLRTEVLRRRSHAVCVGRAVRSRE